MSLFKIQRQFQTAALQASDTGKAHWDAASSTFSVTVDGDSALFGRVAVGTVVYIGTGNAAVSSISGTGIRSFVLDAAITAPAVGTDAAIVFGVEDAAGSAFGDRWARSGVLPTLRNYTGALVPASRVDGLRRRARRIRVRERRFAVRRPRDPPARFHTGIHSQGIRRGFREGQGVHPVGRDIEAQGARVRAQVRRRGGTLLLRRPAGIEAVPRSRFRRSSRRCRGRDMDQRRQGSDRGGGKQGRSATGAGGRRGCRGRRDFGEASRFGHRGCPSRRGPWSTASWRTRRCTTKTS